MEERELQQRLHLLHEQVEAAVSLTEDHKLDFTSAIDTLKIEVEVLRRIMRDLHPDFDRIFAATKEKVLHEVDPERSDSESSE